jgi:diguanylate cyclase (GGDEF)-like protein
VPTRKSAETNAEETDFITRHSGEEFVIQLMQTPGSLAADVAEKAEFNNGDARIPITQSIGFSSFCASDGPEEVFARADAVLYRAKAGGRNQVCGGGRRVTKIRSGIFYVL